ncbi:MULTISPECIES: CHAT domain-containing protein [Pseudanabaena]|jgi:CHAT domain-containing protein|uniref:CHAT domain-containing protein n=1 Tax=Pseudanabaena TaxID=1152 RepID=UPI0024787440|nr:MULTISPECIES: CHAT domain-containing protein [Pseudanabaena]MEA5490033.1 CHAT domain-containing protein [Pseudanabaena sp. CCNP1317]WGS71831.1 CHAT domain-containing protein [Pseudanabaena galeata CCNP1313]
MKTFFTSLAAVLLLAAPAWSSPIALIPHPPIQSATVSAPEKLHQAGHNAFAEGRFAEAASQWQQAATLYRQQGDRLHEAVLLANLALTYRELGQWQEATSAITTSLELTKSLQPVTADVQRAIAQALDTQGSLAFAQGKSEVALQTWQEALILHQQLSDEPARIRNVINQARAYQRLGLFIRSHQMIAIANASVMQQPDSLLKVELLHHIGNILMVIDEPAKSLPYLQQSRQILAKLGDSPAAHTLKSGILRDLGHLAQTRTEDEDALATTLNFYTEAITTAFYPLDRIYAQLSLADLLITTNQQTELDHLLIQMQPNIEMLPLSRNGIENRIRYAEILGKHGQREAAALLLAKAIAQAKTLGDNRTHIYALGTLGHLYEQNQQFPEAISLTREAIVMAQANNTDELTYQWHWQLARLLKATGKNEESLISYNQAVEVLKSIQSDLASASTNAQFSFQESVEPLYREYVSLLLDTSGSNDKQNNQQKLKQTQSVIESLKFAELVNFFRNDCLKTQSNDVTKIDRTAAIVYVITLSDRLEVLLTLPDGNIKRYTTAIAASEVESNAIDFRTNLRDVSSQDYLESAQTIYNWTVRPLEADLASNKVQTLVIVSDDALRNIPFAALHDGKQFLIEKYNLASSPGLQLLDSKPISKKQINVLLVGLTQSRFAFSTLPAVQQELESIQKRVGSNRSEILLNDTFTSQNLQHSLQAFPFPVVHIATHGQFSSKAIDTFIVAWDRKVNIEQLNGILRSLEHNDTEPLELLILSACQTATGDKRSALGLAGIAVRAGARSTIGSLWQISDDATAILMSDLYAKLADRNVTRAEALRSSQLTLLKNKKFDHPYYWSPFILLGNWQ